VARVIRINDLESISVAGVNWRPLRRTLGITAFGTNAYSADAGEEVVEAHTEGSGHEEMYVVLSGRARFTVGDSEQEVGAGSVVFFDDHTEQRGAVALEDGTTVLAVGGMPGTLTPSAWEWRFAAEPAYNAGDYARAYEICAEGLAVHPDDVALHYQLACFANLGGDRERALADLRRALELDPEKVRRWAADDTDLEGVWSSDSAS
jgi:tetratricopeptide (TPR) repeat protein